MLQRRFYPYLQAASILFRDIRKGYLFVLWLNYCIITSKSINKPAYRSITEIKECIMKLTKITCPRD